MKTPRVLSRLRRLPILITIVRKGQSTKKPNQTKKTQTHLFLQLHCHRSAEHRHWPSFALAALAVLLRVFALCEEKKTQFRKCTQPTKKTTRPAESAAEPDADADAGSEPAAAGAARARGAKRAKYSCHNLTKKKIFVQCNWCVCLFVWFGYRSGPVLRIRSVSCAKRTALRPSVPNK